MKINITDILLKHVTEKSYDLECVIPDIDFNGDVVKFLKPSKVSLFVTLKDDYIIVKGNFSADVEMTCYKCAESFTTNISFDISEKYSKEKDEEQGIYEYSGKDIELTDMLVDNVILNMPGRILCKEDCKGLCKVCGINLNNNTCKCDKIEEYNPAFEKLKRLKNN